MKQVSDFAAPFVDLIEETDGEPVLLDASGRKIELRPAEPETIDLRAAAYKAEMDRSICRDLMSALRRHAKLAGRPWP